MINKSKNIEIDFQEDEILFLKGYYFKCSSIHIDKKITSKQISEINLNTFPPSLVFQDNEIIFIEHKYKSELEQFAINNTISLYERFDIWEHLNRPFLDTKFSESDQNNTTKLLIENGVSENEITQIRKKINRAMSKNSFAWEWVYLGLFDYLSWTLFTKKNYWWAMNIALRNFNKTPSENFKETN